MTIKKALTVYLLLAIFSLRDRKSPTSKYVALVRLVVVTIDSLACVTAMA